MGDRVMMGVIRKRDVLSHPLVTIQCFGWVVFLRTLVAGRSKTFLAILVDADILEAKRVRVPQLIERCIQLELRASRLYGALARRFEEREKARELFASLSLQEKEHAELLEVCRASANLGPRAEKRFEPWAEALPLLEDEMASAEARLDRIDTVIDALRLAIRIESSEVNRVFQGVIAATDSPFVSALGAFHDATERHLSYICRCAPEIEPSLRDQCLVMHESFHPHPSWS